MDTELKKLKLGVLRTKEDKLILDELVKVLRNERREVSAETR